MRSVRFPSKSSPGSGGCPRALRSRRGPTLRITDKAFGVREEMQDWLARPLDEGGVRRFFVDAIVVKVRRRSGRELADLCRDRRQRRR